MKVLGTSVKVNFIVTGDDFNPEEITRQLGVEPNRCWSKGDQIEGTLRNRIDTVWMMCTEDEESLDVNVQLKKILSRTEPLRDALKEIRVDSGIECLFAIVVNVVDNQTPALYFDKRFIEFVSYVGAEFYVDLYM